jgi:hypothetical protein
MTFPLLILSLCCAGYAISAAVFMILLKRTMEEWWEENYGRDRATMRRHQWIRNR